MLQINFKEKITIRKANKGINVEKDNNRFKKLQEEGKTKKIPQNCKSPT